MKKLWFIARLQHSWAVTQGLLGHFLGCSIESHCCPVDAEPSREALLLHAQVEPIPWSWGHLQRAGRQAAHLCPAQIMQVRQITPSWQSCKQFVPSFPFSLVLPLWGPSGTWALTRLQAAVVKLHVGVRAFQRALIVVPPGLRVV